MKLFLPAAVLAPFVAAAAVRWWQARRQVRPRERWILWVPIGGSVVVGFRSQLSPGRRALVLVGAAAASYFTVAALALIGVLATGEPIGTSRYVVSEVTAGTPADGRFASGDRIDTFDGAPLRFEEGPHLSVRVQQAGERPIRFDVLRGGRPVTIEVTPRPTEEGVLRLGIELSIDEIREHPGSGTALAHALFLPAHHAGRVLAALRENATAAPEQRADFMGPVGITHMLSRIEGTGRTFDAGLYASVYFLVWAALVDLVLLAGIGLSRSGASDPEYRLVTSLDAPRRRSPRGKAGADRCGSLSGRRRRRSPFRALRATRAPPTCAASRFGRRHATCARARVQEGPAAAAPRPGRLGGGRRGADGAAARRRRCGRARGGDASAAAAMRTTTMVRTRNDNFLFDDFCERARRASASGEPNAHVAREEARSAGIARRRRKIAAPSTKAAHGGEEGAESSRGMGGFMQAENVSMMSDGELVARPRELLGEERRLTAAVLVHLGEVEARRLYLPAACPSMHGYCTRAARRPATLPAEAGP